MVTSQFAGSLSHDRAKERKVTAGSRMNTEERLLREECVSITKYILGAMGRH
jgi:hypothetical protein